jgi:hypothetical protein
MHLFWMKGFGNVKEKVGKFLIDYDKAFFKSSFSEISSLNLNFRVVRSISFHRAYIQKETHPNIEFLNNYVENRLLK